MNLPRFILRPAAKIAGMHAAGQYKNFITAARQGRQTQYRLLRRLVEYHADTRFGRDHGLSAVRSYEDFIKAVPIRDYEEMRTYLQPVYEGQTEALFPRHTKILMFAISSGTTGEPKHIPVT